MGFYKDNQGDVTIQCGAYGAGMPLTLSSFARWFMVPDKDLDRVFKDLSFNRYQFLDKQKPDLLMFVKNYADYRAGWPQNTILTEERKKNMDYLAVSYLIECEATFTPEQRAQNKQAFVLFDKLLREQQEREGELSLLSGKSRCMMSKYYRESKNPQEVSTERALLKKEHKENEALLSLAETVTKAEEKKKDLQTKKFAFFRSARMYFAEKALAKATAALKAKQQEVMLSTLLDPSATIGRVEWRMMQLESGDFSYVPAPPESGACQPKIYRGESDKYKKYQGCFALSQEEKAKMEAFTEKYYSLPREKREELGKKVLAGQSAIQVANEELMVEVPAATANPSSRKPVDLTARLHNPKTKQNERTTRQQVPTRTKEQNPVTREPIDE